MPNVVFVAPFYLDTTPRFLRAVAGLEEPAERLPPAIAAR